ncbi:uncharacterized protein LOC135374993 isoform X3 [Ornithodoros turicata]|uniref:uncharacterized protein LOC135374993 isoform X3 n=1 Tax=Ornithodoros turicata TaxID=34597 RepID=UPI003139FA7C
MEDKQSKCHADEIPRGERGSGLESLSPVYADEGEVKLQDISIPEHYSHDDIWYKMDNLNAGKKCGICAIIKVGMQRFGGVTRNSLSSLIWHARRRKSMS